MITDTDLTIIYNNPLLSNNEKFNKLESMRPNLFIEINKGDGNNAAEAARLLFKCSQMQDQLTPKVSAFYKPVSTSPTSISSGPASPAFFI